MVFLSVVELWWCTIILAKLLYQMEGYIVYLAN